MLLGKLLDSLIVEEVQGNDRIAITRLTADSRQCCPGAAFVAVVGPDNDGHKYIDAAMAAGASAVVCEQIPTQRHSSVTWVRVADSAVALGVLASEWYGNPSRHLQLVGVTGTNGKTTIATLLYEMARLSGMKAGLISTVENRVDDKVYATSNTTPSPLEINRLLAEMVESGCSFAAMEVSSHGQVQKRTSGLHFAGGLFTNLTRDHLDYHKTFDAYLKAKKSFFDNLPRTAFALVNADDTHGRVMVQNTSAHVATYSLRQSASFTCRVLESRIDGMSLRIDGRDIESVFAGRFNASNLVAVYGAWVLLGHTPEQTAVLLSRLVPVAGRMQSFRSADSVTAIVDYAHTPDALGNVLSTIAQSAPTAHITVVTGAGGNRDHGKRPLMGAEAAKYAQRIIITADNPRDEDPADIADDIKAGVPVDSPARVDIILERAAAIHVAITEAHPGDVVVIAGKGHELYQEFENRRRIHFDDREQAKKALEERTRPIASTNN